MSLKLPYLKRVSTRINQPQLGFSLVELLIAMTIGIFAVGAALSVLSESEARKRSTGSVNNSNQAGAYAVYQLDQAIRSAGTGLGHESATSLNLPSGYGCFLNIAKSGNQIIPTAGLPAPFSSINSVRLAPVLIKQGATNQDGDIIVTMAGASGLAELPTKFGLSGSSTTTTLNLENNVNFKAADKVLLVGNSDTNCFVSQVESTFMASESSPQLALDGTYHADTIGGHNITDANAYTLNLGQTPHFNMFAVGENNTLVSYNIFDANNAAATTPNPSILVNNVVQMKALYGVEVAGAIQWRKPNGAYRFDKVQNNISKINAIKAIKLALVMKTDLQEKDRVSNNSIWLFNDTNRRTRFKITGTDRKFRHQLFEVTIPVRNNLLQP
jgi:type IV pilus assembly protein PilW